MIESCLDRHGYFSCIVGRIKSINKTASIFCRLRITAARLVLPTTPRCRGASGMSPTRPRGAR